MPRGPPGLDRPGAPIRLGLAAGDHLRVDEMSLAVLWPLRGRVPREPPDTGTGINNVSVVLLGAIGDRRFLLAGDVEQDIDPALLTEGLPRVDVLKVAHHGSKTATTQAFVDAVRPRVAIASAGADNPYGHPARSTLQRLSDAGARVYRTDRDGTVTVAFEPGGPTVRTEPRRAGDGPASRLPVAARHAPTPATSASRAFLCAVPLAFVPPAPPAPPVAFGDEPPPDWAGRRTGPDARVPSTR